jgi:hypothetical protein
MELCDGGAVSDIYQGKAFLTFLLPFFFAVSDGKFQFSSV